MSITSRLKQQIFIRAQRAVPQHKLSRVIGKVAASENPLVKNAVITAFKAQYGIDMSIAEQGNALKFKSFNEFFTRSLKQGVREIDDGMAPARNLDLVARCDNGGVRAGFFRGEKAQQAGCFF